MESLTPAIKFDENTPLSSEDFQKLLYEYFEDKGILSDLRAHLRAQMIKVLRDTSLGKELMDKKKDISPKLQALNLLIAEYLLQKQYHYSLSVFSTEIPLSNVFQNFGQNFSDKDLVKFHFTDSDMWDILETLGFSKLSEQGKCISFSYKSNEEEPLLQSVIRSVHGQYQNGLPIPSIDKSHFSQLKNKLPQMQEWDIEQFISLLGGTGLNTESAIKIINQINNTLANELIKMNKLKDIELDKMKRNFEGELNAKLEKYKKKLIQMESSFDKERKRLEAELENAKGNLKGCAKTLQNKYRSLNKFSEDLKAKEDKLRQQEEYLLEKDKELKKQSEKIFTQKNFQKDTLLKLKELKQEKNELKGLANDLHDKSQQTLENINLDNVLLRQNAHQLQLEVNDLRHQNQLYMSRIQEMVLRTNTLMRDLESSQQRVNELNGEHRETNTLSRLPSIPRLNYRTRCGIASYTGAGEEGTTSVPLSPRHFRNVSPPRERTRSQNRNHRLVFPLPSTSSDETSPTEELLRETKKRLHSLEKESEQIDKHFDMFKNHFDHSANTTSLLKDFQLNVASIRNSLSRIFQRDKLNPTRFENPRKSSCKPPTNSMQNDDFEKCHNLVVESPRTLNLDEFDDVLNSLLPNIEKKETNTTGESSGVALGSSISTINLSSDCNDTDTKVPKSDAGTSGTNLKPDTGIWNAGVTCLIMFTLEVILFG